VSAKLERLPRPLQPHGLLRGCENDALRGTRIVLSDLDVLARADLGIAALQAIEPDDIKSLVFGIGKHGPRDGRILADDFEHVPFHCAKAGKRFPGQAGNAVAAFLLPGRSDLQPDGAIFDFGWGIGHLAHPSRLAWTDACRSQAARD